MEQPAPNPLIQSGELEGKGGDPFKQILQLLGKFLSEAGTLILVPESRLFDVPTSP